MVTSATLGVVLVAVVSGVMTACCSVDVYILMCAQGNSICHPASSIENVNTCCRCFPLL